MGWIEKTYTVTEAAKELGMTPQQLYNDHKAGRISFLKKRGARRYRVAVSELERYMSKEWEADGPGRGADA